MSTTSSTQAIIPAKPDAWIWLGDMAYFDIPVMDCHDAKNKHHPDCTCEPTLLQHAPTGCMTGNVQNAQRKLEGILRSDGYMAFLEFMCPDFMARGHFPPDGSSTEICARPIIGVYDDHDFGWNNGNGKQLPNRAAIKQARRLSLSCMVHVCWCTASC